MILYDFSSVVHRSLFTSIKNVSPHKKDGKFITSEYISYTIHRILDEILSSYNLYSREFGSMILCLDNHSKPYWRKTIYPAYKEQRKKVREDSDINYPEVYKHVDLLIQTLKDYSNFKLISVPGAEADDIIGYLTRKYGPYEKILILSPDKDFKQLHKFGDIKQWSHLTNKWVINENPEDWEMEHICLGDASDNVPRIVDFSVFSDSFKEFYKGTELDFYMLSHEDRNEVLKNYDVKKPNGDLDIYKSPRFGLSTLKKSIEKYGSLDKFLDSNPIYRLNYERNRKLVLDSEIPVKIEAEINTELLNTVSEINLEKLKTYLNYYDLTNIYSRFQELANSYAEPIKMTSLNCDFSNIRF